MRLLLLGGPMFLGRAVADTALADEHELTFFNRGRTNPELYPEFEKLRGDRDGDLGALASREWDAVINTSGYLPHAVRASAEALAGSGLYCFVSSISVYADFSRPVDEESELAPLGDLPVDQMAPDHANYGALKALCEHAVRDVFGERALLVRPGLIVGPHDPTGRFTYWPHRAARGGEILAPEPPERMSQFVDVRDLGRWIVELCERQVPGTLNATHPGVTLGELLEACVAVAGSDADVAWVTDEFLVQREVGEWVDLPLWLTGPEHAYMDRVNVSRALAGGLSFRPLEDTVRGTLEKASTTEAAGLSAEREAELLAAWHGRVETESRSDKSDPDRRPSPLSKKLGAKPGAGVVVFFTTTRDELERRFDGLKATLDPADGLWIAWPKKAARIEGDLSFEAVQEIGLAHGLVDNKSCSIDEGWQALRFVYRLEDRQS